MKPLEYEKMDASVWAKNFIEITQCGLDLDTAHAWFANAIMTGYDHGRGPINGDHAQYLIDQQTVEK